MVNLELFLNHLNQGLPVTSGSEIQQFMTLLSNEARKITMELNTVWHDPEEIRELFSQLTGTEVDEGFRCFRRFILTAGKTSMWEKMCLSTPDVSFRIREESRSVMTR